MQLLTLLLINDYPSYEKKLPSFQWAASKTWIKNSEKLEPWQILTQKNMDLEEPGPRKTWITKNIENSQMLKKDWKTE